MREAFGGGRVYIFCFAPDTAHVRHSPAIVCSAGRARSHSGTQHLRNGRTPTDTVEGVNLSAATQDRSDNELVDSLLRCLCPSTRSARNDEAIAEIVDA
jgi:hypothetical protein